ncbi:MAG: aldehyde dehydrogenase family protein, partial [Bacteroidota bacterium]
NTVHVLKTYKLYIDGKFPRTESGRSIPYKVKEKQIANICRSSRKDLRNAVVAARKAQESWANKTAFNRSQILYRIAEMLEGRKSQFIEEIMLQGFDKKSANNEVRLAIDRVIYFAGWADKFQQVFSSVNPVASDHFNFSIYEPTGVVFAFADDETALIGLISSIIPIICGGNTCIILASERFPLSAITFAEVLNSSDVPAGVVNILTGLAEELISHAGSHKDINAISYARSSKNNLSKLKELAADNVKRVHDERADFWSEACANPYVIMNYCEVKTTWHPIEKIGASGSGY